MVFAVVWAIIALHPFPEQTDKTNNSNGNAQPQPSPTSANQAPTPRPSPPKEKDGSDGESSQATWVERTVRPLVDNWPVVVVAIWGILVARSTLKSIDRQAGLMEGQLKEMQKQAEVMDGQLKEMRGTGAQIGQQIEIMQGQLSLQEITMRQWVIIRDWSHDPYRSDEASDSWAVWVRFNIVNPTNWPLTILFTKIRIGPNESHAAHDISVAPDDPYSIEMRDIPIDYHGTYLKYTQTKFTVFMSIIYRDCFQKIREEIFSGVLTCTKQRKDFFRMESLPHNPFIPDNPYFKKAPEQVQDAETKAN